MVFTSSQRMLVFVIDYMILLFSALPQLSGYNSFSIIQSIIDGILLGFEWVSYVKGYNPKFAMVGIIFNVFVKHVMQTIWTWNLVALQTFRSTAPCSSVLDFRYLLMEISMESVTFKFENVLHISTLDLNFNRKASTYPTSSVHLSILLFRLRNSACNIWLLCVNILQQSTAIRIISKTQNKTRLTYWISSFSVEKMKLILHFCRIFSLLNLTLDPVSSLSLSEITWSFNFSNPDLQVKAKEGAYYLYETK